VWKKKVYPQPGQNGGASATLERRRKKYQKNFELEKGAGRNWMEILER